ncbi:unnamed protein product [Victoria cruziana]
MRRAFRIGRPICWFHGLKQPIAFEDRLIRSLKAFFRIRRIVSRPARSLAAIRWSGFQSQMLLISSLDMLKSSASLFRCQIVRASLKIAHNQSNN